MDSFDKYLELVPQQYKNSPNLLHLLRTVNAEVSDVKNMLSELSVLTSIADATGVQLDNIGAWKGKPRKSGESDAAYRVRLKSLTGTKIPTFKAVREAAMELNGTPWALVCPDWPAGMYIVTEAPGTELKLNLDNLAAAGESCLLGSFLTDEDDDLILDEDGNPIVIDYVHVENEERWNAPASLKLADGGYIRLASGGFIELVGQTGGVIT